MHEGRLRAGLAGGFEEIECPDSVGVEIVERNRGSAVVRGLGGRMYYGGWFKLFDQGDDPGAVADVELMVLEAVEFFGEALLVPSGIALGAEKNRALIVVNAVDSVAEFACEMHADFRTNQAR